MSYGLPGDRLPQEPVDLPGSFSAFLRARGMEPSWDPRSDASALQAPEGTTILAFRFGNGVIMAGDRRATAGSTIAHRRVQKVFAADQYSVVSISGTAGIAVEMTRLFQTELEHYEKLEDHRLSLEGKANYLAAMIRRQLPMAMQGLVVIPLFAGYDEDSGTGRLFSFDVVGGRYEEIDYTATGSGGRDARSYLRSVYQPDVDEAAAVRTAVEALFVAAEEDSATGGPDLRREIYPNVVVVDADGLREIPEETLADLTRSVLESDL